MFLKTPGEVDDMAIDRIKVATVYLGRMGGAPIYALSMAKALDKLCEQRVFLSSSIENAEKWKESELNCSFYETFDSNMQALLSLILSKNLYTLKRDIIDFEPDVIYYPMSHLWDYRISRTVKRELGKAIVVETVHDPLMHSGEKLLRRLADGQFNKAIRASDKCVILSSVFRKIMASRYGFNTQDILVLPHGVFDYYTQFDGQDSGIPKRARFRIGFVGRISRYKGVDLLLEAFKGLWKEHDAELLIAGSGAVAESEKQIIEQLPEERITVINRWLTHQEIAKYICSTDILVCAYRDGTQSGVASAAYALGVPVIVSDSGGLPEQAGYGEYALVVKAGDSKSLAQGITSLLTNKDERERLSSNALAHARRSLSWEILAKKLVGFLSNTPTNPNDGENS